MSKVVLNDVTSGSNVSTINTNFTKIEEALNNQVLYRDNPAGEPNAMSQDLDMNGKRIYNHPAPQQPGDLARLQDVQVVSGVPAASIIPYTPNASIPVTTVQSAIDYLTSNNGSGAIGYKHPYVNSHQRSVGDALSDWLNIMDVIPVAEHAAIKNGTTSYDATIVIQTALNAGYSIAVPPRYTFVVANLNSVANTAIVCIGGRAKFKVAGGLLKTGITINTSNFVLEGIDFDGGNMGPYNTVSATIGSRNGILIGNTFGTGAQMYNITVQNCDVYGFDVAGIQGREVQIGFEFGKRVVLNNINCYKNYINIWASPRFEYVTATNCYGYFGYAGIILQGGNNTWVACHFENNYENCQLAPGENDAHGQFIGCSFNHAVWRGLNALNVQNGQTFTGCAFWYAPIALTECIGIQIRNSQIVNSPVVVTGGGVNSIDDNWIKTPISKTFSGFTFTTFRNNRTNANDVDFKSTYGDVSAVSTGHKTLSYPLTFNTTTLTEIPLTYSTQRWHGEAVTFLEDGGRAYVPVTAQYTVDFSAKFNTAGTAEMLTAELVHYAANGTTVLGTYASSTYAPASTTGASMTFSQIIHAAQGEWVALRVKTTTGTGVTVATGGLRVSLRSED